MMQLQRGFLLPMVLIFLEIFSLLGLYGWTKVVRMSQLLSQQERRENALRLAQAILINLESREIMANCVIAKKFTTSLMTKPLTWWQNQACNDTLENTRYYYAIESLGLDECGLVGAGFVPDFYRISVVIPNDDESKLVVQSIIAKPAQATLVCGEQPHSVKIGRQMWRVF